MHTSVATKNNNFAHYKYKKHCDSVHNQMFINSNILLKVVFLPDTQVTRFKTSPVYEMRF